MDGRQELNRLDLELLDAIGREWQAERIRSARQDHLLQGSARQWRSGAGRRGLLLASAVVVAALLVGLAVAVASASAGSLGAIL
jgi:hypothetical protein